MTKSYLAWTLILGMGVTGALPAAAADSSLWSALHADDPAAVQAAVEAGADLAETYDPYGATPLGVAASRGDAAIVRYLISAGADVNGRDANGLSALSYAVRSGKASVDVIDALIDAGADIENRSGAHYTPLLVAIQNGRTDIALALVARGADANATNMYGDGPLNFAIYYRNRPVIRALVDAGANTDQLRVLFATSRYYFPGFGRAPLTAPKDRTGRARP